ncbi:MAG: toll/interleukin-1 receptor domain-containing protein [Acidobacteria bacterium]|nr:toll/interleukin-1 receptor domain-containing protein [Acidobacteriota bacterium]
MKVFLSHAHSDKALAKRIAKGLKRAGLEVWDAESEILPGENWADKTAQALRDSQAMVVLLTPNTFQSSNVSLEIGYALGSKEYKKRLIPVIVGSSENLPQKNFPWILNHFQMIELPEQGKQQDAGIKQIAQTLLEAA